MARCLLGRAILHGVGGGAAAQPGPSFEPKIVGKRQRRLIGVEDMVISLVAKGLTTGAVQAHLAEIYGPGVSRQTISTITGKVLDGVQECVSGSGRAGRTGREPRNVHEESSVTYGRGESDGGTPEVATARPVRPPQVTALCAGQASASEGAWSGWK